MWCKTYNNVKRCPKPFSITLSDYSLEEFFEMAARCSEWGIDVSTFYELTPWHVLSIIDINIFRNEEKLKQLEKRRNLGGLS